MKIWKYTFVVLILAISLLILALFQLPDFRFHLIACNVGEGDATLLIYKNTQVLVDGGPDRRVLDCLGKYLPFWDRTIELVILTHPDRDHFAGLNDVLRGYRIVSFMYNPLTISKPEYKLLEKEVGRGGITHLDPTDVRKMRLGLIYLDILAPMQSNFAKEVPLRKEKEVSDSETNAYSIVSLISFGKFRALLTGDMASEVSDRLAKGDSIGPLDYIKIPHHGSKNGITQNLLNVVEPKIAVISVGKNNYGHPSGEVIQMLNARTIKTLRTDERGDIEIVVDKNGSVFISQ